MTLFSLAEIRKRNEDRRCPNDESAGCYTYSGLYCGTHDSALMNPQTVRDIDALIEEIERLRSIRLPSGNDR